MLGRGVQCTVLAHHDLGVPHGHIGQVGETGAVLTGVASAQRAGGGNLAGGGGVLEGSQDGLDGLGGQVFVVVVVDLDHGGVDAGAEALDFDVCEETVLGGVAGGDSEVLGDGLDDGGTTTATKLAWGLCRGLELFGDST